jgi:hypothetical protein
MGTLMRARPCGHGKHLPTISVTRDEAIGEVAASIAELNAEHSAEAAHASEVKGALLSMLRKRDVEPIGRCTVCHKIVHRAARAEEED